MGEQQDDKIAELPDGDRTEEGKETPKTIIEKINKHKKILLIIMIMGAIFIAGFCLGYGLGFQFSQSMIKPCLLYQI